MYNVLRMLVGVLLAFLIVLWLVPGVVLAAGTPAHTETIAAGPYIIDATLSQDPPYVDQPFDVTVVPHDRSIQLSGVVIAQPGLGTNANKLQWPLVAVGDHTGTLKSSIHIPVKGAWNILFKLDGPQGSGEARVAIVMSAPGAMPFWLAWIIGCIPLSGVIVWVIYQRRYHQKIAAQQQA